MKTNAIIDEIHKIRESHAKRFNFDIEAIFNDIKRKQAECVNLVDLSVPNNAQAKVAEGKAEYRAVKRD